MPHPRESAIRLADALEPPPTRPAPKATRRSLAAVAVVAVVSTFVLLHGGCATVQLTQVATVEAVPPRRAAQRILSELFRDPRLKDFRRELRRSPGEVRLRLVRPHRHGGTPARDIVALDIRQGAEGATVFLAGWHEDSVGRQIEDGHLHESLLAARQAVERAGRRLVASASVR